MLYSIAFGDRDIPHFEIYEDKFQNKYFSSKEIRQRIRLGKKTNIDEFVKDDAHSSSKMIGYKTPDCLITNNYNNMNISMMNHHENSEHHQKNLIYLTIDQNTYNLIDYTIYDQNEIIQTYRSLNDKYFGCTIICDQENSKHIATIYLKAYRKREYVKKDIDINEKGSLIINENIIDLSDEDLHQKEKKLGKFLRYNHFKMDLVDDHLITNTYIVDEDHQQEASEFLEKEKPSANLIVLPMSMLDVINGKASNDDLASAADNLFNKELVEKRIRAVTEYGTNCKMPKAFCKKYKILYLFRYNDHKIECLKCN